MAVLEATPADEIFLRQALHEAERAGAEGEVPVGAVIVHQGRIIGRGRNHVETGKDATAHAEVLAIGAASEHIGDWRLEECTLYVTLEPCPMCTGAIINARIPRVVYGAKDTRLGACGSACDLVSPRLLNRELQVTGGVLEEECRGILQEFFRKRRQEKPSLG